MKRRQAQAKTVYVAMSGGVDSSVAALLLQKQGYRVVGVFMKPWQAPGVRCLWQADRQDALRVAAALDIPLLTWDFSKVYGTRVARAMINGYRRGITPNPDVACNKEIKFGLFYQKAIRAGADFVATGHYARLMKNLLYVARDRNKDQTYFLWAIPPRCLERTIFPIGGLIKLQVRAIAARAGLITADKKDSQGVCFVGPMDVRSFLSRHIRLKSGPIVHRDGRMLGIHEGAALYTIGQRHGLNIRDGGGPYYVTGKDMRRNIVFIGSERDLYVSRARIADIQWFGIKPAVGSRVSVKIRYRTPAYYAIMRPAGRIEFLRPVRAIAPGQSAVIYQGSRVLGGGVIAELPKRS